MPKPLLAVLLLTALAACGEGHSPYARTPDTGGDGTGGDASAAAATPRAGVIAGRIEADGIDPGGFRCVYLMGRRDADARFPELVKRLPAGPFPLSFELTARDLVGVGSLRGPWVLTARLDRDGDAPASKGDRQGSASVTVGDNTPLATIVLDETVSEDAPPLDTLDLSMGAHGAGAAGAGMGSRAMGGLPAGHPAVAPGSMQGMSGATSGAAEGIADAQPTEAGDGPHISAEIRLPDGATAAASKGVLFFFARATDAKGGMPLAVKRVVAPSFPVTLTIGTDDVPLQVENKAQMLDRTLYLSASLDADGNASTKTTGDLVAGPVRTTDDGSTTVLVLAPRELP